MFVCSVLSVFSYAQYHCDVAVVSSHFEDEEIESLFSEAEEWVLHSREVCVCVCVGTQGQGETWAKKEGQVCQEHPQACSVGSGQGSDLPGSWVGGQGVWT